jgi:hypothetical protein
MWGVAFSFFGLFVRCMYCSNDYKVEEGVLWVRVFDVQIHGHMDWVRCDKGFYLQNN